MPESEPPPERKSALNPRWPVLAVAAVAFFSHFTALNAPFLWDDHWLMSSHPVVSGARPLWHAFITAFWEDHPDQLSPYYRPLVIFLLALDRRLFGVSPAGFHVTNLLLHAVVSVLVYVVARRAGATVRAAATSAALFATLPRLTESVAWVSGRTDLLATLFLLAALLAHQRDARPRPVMPAVTAWVLAALFSKETALVAPALLVASDAAQRPSPPLRALALRAVPAFTAVGLALVLRWLVAGVPLPSGTDGGTGSRLVLFLRTLGHYVFMALTPARPTARIGDRLGGFDAWAFLGLAALAFLAWWALRTWRAGEREDLAPVVWSALALLPVLNLVPATIYNLAADRFLYLPLAGLTMLVAKRLSRWEAAAPRAALAVSTLALCHFIVISARHGALYTDEVAYWTEAVRHAPPSDMAAHVGLGEALIAAREYEAAEQRLKLALEIGAAWSAPRSLGCKALARRAIALSQLGRDEQARAEMEENRAICASTPGEAAPVLAAVRARQLDFDGALRVLSAVPGERWTHNMRVLEQDIARAQSALASGGNAPELAAARALTILGAARKAEARLRRAVATKEPGARLELARWLVERERFSEALELLTALVDATPDHPLAHYWMGYALLSLDRKAEGRAHLRRALELDPDMPNRDAVIRILGEEEE